MRTYRSPLALAALAALTLGCGASPVMATYEGDDWMESFMQADFTRFFRVHVPDRPELGPAAPLVLAFHGSSQNAEQFQGMSGLNATADAEGFIVAYLEAPMGAWDSFGSMEFLGLDDLDYVRQVIDRVGRRNVIDRNRVIAVGLSNGGVFVQRLGCKLSDRIAGFVAVAASMPRLLTEDCASTRPVSAMYILGTADTFFPAAGSKVLLPFDSTVNFWARKNRCDGGRVSAALLDAEDDGTRVYVSSYRSCDNGSHAVLDSIVGGGHAWPGSTRPAPEGFGPTSRDISANAEIVRLLGMLSGR
jgi:polyhydroxybutyrate depolymerase